MTIRVWATFTKYFGSLLCSGWNDCRHWCYSDVLPLTPDLGNLKSQMLHICHGMFSYISNTIRCHGGQCFSLLLHLSKLSIFFVGFGVGLLSSATILTYRLILWVSSSWSNTLMIMIHFASIIPFFYSS